MSQDRLAKLLALGVLVVCAAAAGALLTGLLLRLL